MGLVPGAGLTKEDVNYRLHEQCNTCTYFWGKSCEKVDGNISPDAVCDKWEIKPKDGPKDGEFYKEAYDKTKEE